MAANKFATMIHRNSHKFVLFLVYAALEWVLIILLLFNSLFTYLISAFASYFGLKPPCLWCSRLDRFLQPEKENSASYRDLVCDTHAAEIADLHYCSAHGKLVNWRHLCHRCLTSLPSNDEDSIEITGRNLNSPRKQIKKSDNVDKILRCFCCNESLNKEPEHPSSFLLRHPTWDACERDRDACFVKSVEDDNSAGTSGKQAHQRDSERNEDDDHLDVADCKDRTFPSFNVSAKANNLRSISDLLLCMRKEAAEDQDSSLPNVTGRDCNQTEQIHQSSCCSPLEFCFVECHSADIETHWSDQYESELIDSSSTVAKKGFWNSKDEDLGIKDHQTRSSIQNVGGVAAARTDNSDERISSVLVAGEGLATVECELVLPTPVVETLSIDTETAAEKEPQNSQANRCQPASSALPDDQFSSKVGMGDCSRGSSVSEALENGKLSEQEKPLLFESTREVINIDFSMHRGPKEAEEDKGPDTPTSMENSHYLHKKLLLFEKREQGAEESLDGSVVSEMEGVDPLTTVERLKAALKAERKALSTLYTELEEERSASAVSANQTMAMITRLQEEKAAMQMEALQYQRMMEEQAEYDREALQLLNELIIKREKEKEELQRELEMYREKMRVNSSSCSGGEESDDMSTDLNHRTADEDIAFSPTDHNEVLNMEEMAVECEKHLRALDDSLEEFQEERLDILDQLKVLEEKLIALRHNEESADSVIRAANHAAKESDENCEFSPEENGYSQENMAVMGSTAKRLLPLLDAADDEAGEGIWASDGHVGPESVELQQGPRPSMKEFDVNNLVIEEEMVHVYERLQALEADGKFLKQSMESVKKGDKGPDLIQEILQHLRDLRTVELRVSNLNADSME